MGCVLCLQKTDLEPASFMGRQPEMRKDPGQGKRIANVREEGTRMNNAREFHKTEVLSFLQKHVPGQDWQVTLPPHGTGNESYFVQSNRQSFFVKLGAKTDRYQVMSELGLSPPILIIGHLEDGTSILVQQQIQGRTPSRRDFHRLLRNFAESLKITHGCEELKQILPKGSSNSYRDAGLKILEAIEQRWISFETEVPGVASYVNEKMAYLKEQVHQFTGSGLVASHNDICNGNWLVSSTDQLYLLDYESMSYDDPALDLGAILWWYYPPQLRSEFLAIAGYNDDEGFRHRMRIRMAIHNLNIILPRERSFDQFQAEAFEEALIDFRAVIDGQENPQGYDD